MNAQVQALVEQAKQSVPAGLAPEQWLEVYHAKFAELIVRECINGIANDTANYEGVGMMSYYQGVQDAVKSIRKHFGVEE